MPAIVMLVLEIIGTVSFAISGAVVAIKARLDIFGVAFIGAVTAIGGGVMRDVLLGKHPATVFSNLHIFAIAVGTALAVFVVTYANRRRFDVLEGKVEHINNVFDAIGLAVFSVMGVEAAFAAGFPDNMLFCVALGMLTGIGGGIFRDILTDTTPFVFKKHIYAIASILGSCAYYLLRLYLDNLTVGAVISMLLVFTVRMLATRYRWSLPRIRLDETATKQ